MLKHSKKADADDMYGRIEAMSMVEKDIYLLLEGV